MTKKIYGLLFMLCSSVAMAQTHSFKIDGTLLNVSDGEVVYLINKNVLTQNLDTLASAVVKNEKFTMNGSVKCPMLYFLTLSNNNNVRMPVFVENNRLTINADINQLQNGTVRGSKCNDELVAYSRKVYPIDSTMSYLVSQYKIAQQSDNQIVMFDLATKLNELEAKKSEFAQDFIKEHKTSYFSPYVIAQNINETNVVKYNELFIKFSSDVQASDMGVAIRNYISKYMKLANGANVALFTGTTPEGTQLSLQEVLDKSKYLLLDFWASWCGPCRNENPKVVALYNKYHNNGLEILSVSLDNNAEKWKTAIEKDKLDWYHVSDLKGWQSEFAAMYGVTGIPALFLLDKNGVIIAKNLRGDELDRKLSELLNTSVEKNKK